MFFRCKNKNYIHNIYLLNMGGKQTKPEKISDEQIMKNITQLFHTFKSDEEKSQFYTYALSSFSEGGSFTPARNRYTQYQEHLNKQLETVNMSKQLDHMKSLVNQNGGGLTSLTSFNGGCGCDSQRMPEQKQPVVNLFMNGGCGCDSQKPLSPASSLHLSQSYMNGGCGCDSQRMPEQKQPTSNSLMFGGCGCDSQRMPEQKQPVPNSLMYGGCGCNNGQPMPQSPVSSLNFSQANSANPMFGGCCGVPSPSKLSAMNTSSSNMTAIQQFGGGDCDSIFGNNANPKDCILSETSTANCGDIFKMNGGDCGAIFGNNNGNGNGNCGDLSPNPNTSTCSDIFKMNGGATNLSEEMNIMPFYSSMTGTDYYNNMQKEHRYMN